MPPLGFSSHVDISAIHLIKCITTKKVLILTKIAKHDYNNNHGHFYLKAFKFFFSRELTIKMLIGTPACFCSLHLFILRKLYQNKADISILRELTLQVIYTCSYATITSSIKSGAYSSLTHIYLLCFVSISLLI